MNLEMVYRSTNDQTLHDKVIEAAANRLDAVNYEIYKNPGQQKNMRIGDNYPDIILTKKGERTVQFIIEVETADSVNLTEATTQWNKYSTEIKASFYLLVPFLSKNDAINLCKKIAISARFGTYQVDKLGNVINISYE
jgi:hypothetical protein